MELKLCYKCGEEIHPKRLQIFPLTNSCVKCSTASQYRAIPVQKGKGDHCWNETIIVGSKGYRNG